MGNKTKERKKICLSEKPIPWFRCYSDTVDDDKLRLLAFEDRWHFIAILCCKAKGIIDSADSLLHRRMSVRLGLSCRELEEVARRLEEVGLIDATTLQPKAWDKRQFFSDTDPTAVDRKRAQREREKQCDQHVTRDVTEMSRVQSKSIEIEKELESKNIHTKIEESIGGSAGKIPAAIDPETGEVLSWAA